MKHPFHIVDGRPWPLTGAVGALLTVAGVGGLLNIYRTNLG